MISEWYEREKKYEYFLRRMKNRNSLSKTDESAKFMHLKEDHMRNSQLKPAYNMQIADAGYESEENYTYLENNGQIAYIKPSDYKRAKKENTSKDNYKVRDIASYKPFYTG